MKTAPGRVFSLAFHPLICSNYIFCHGVKAQSDFFIRKRSPERIGNNTENIETIRQLKRMKEQLEVPIVMVDNTQSSSTGSTEATMVAPTTPYSATAEQVLNRNRNAIKLDRLVDKIDRYTSHDEFIRKCMEGNIIPNSYKIILEPSIGNHDDTFLKGYYELLDNFATQKEKSEQDLRNTTPDETFTELQKTLEVNHGKGVKALKEVKDKKYIRLKYRPPPNNRQPVYGETQNGEREIINQGRFPSQNQHTTNRGRISRQNSRTNIRGNPNGPSRKNSRTYIAKPHSNNGGQAHEHENKINELQLQLNELRQAQDQNQKKQI